MIIICICCWCIYVNVSQNTGLSVEIGGEDHMHSQHLLTEHIKALMMMHFADDEEGSGDGSEEDDANDDIGFEGDEEDDEEEDNYDPPPSMSTAFFRQSSLDCRGYLSPVAKVVSDYSFVNSPCPIWRSEDIG